MPRNTIFNIRRHRLLRTRIPLTENLASVILICVLAGVIIWVLAQRDAYDPATRDLPPELLVREGPAIEIYNAPLSPWAEPGQSRIHARAALGPLPETILDEQWQLLGRVKTFDADNLYEKINGEAERFLKQGFVSLSYAVLRSAEDGSEMAIELYDQGSVGGSIGIFSQHVSDNRAVRQQDGVSYFMTSAGVIGRNGRFFFRVAGDRQSEPITAKSAQLVEAFAGLTLEAEETPEGLRILTQGMGVAQQNVSFQKSNVFQFDFANDFWFGSLEQDGAARLFVHAADSAAAASALMEAILEEQSADYRPVGSEADGTTLQHTFLSTYFAIGQRGRFVFGVENLPDREAVGPIMAQFREQTDGD